MLVQDLRTEHGGGVTRFVGTVHWEDQQRDPFDVFFALDEREAERVTLEPDAFRIPAAVVASHDGEDRLAGGGPMCTVLEHGLASSLQWLARWSNRAGTPALDVPIGCAHAVPTGTGSSGLFVSGGVDSTAVLVASHTRFEPDHPLRISLGIVVVGIQIHRWTAWTDLRDRLRAARQDLAWLEAATGIKVVPVATNISTLKESPGFWVYEYMGAVLAGVGHLFSKTLSNLSIASGVEIRSYGPHGSHPLLDPGYGSHSLRIWHEQAHMGRLAKTRLIATRPELLGRINVCNEAEAGDENCGRCEKCLRTMLALESMSLLATTPAFAQSTVHPRDLRHIRIYNSIVEGDYLGLVEPLVEAGRADLATAVKRKLRQAMLFKSRAYKRAVRTARAWGLLPRRQA